MIPSGEIVVILARLPGDTVEGITMKYGAVFGFRLARGHGVIRDGYRGAVTTTGGEHEDQQQ